MKRSVKILVSALLLASISLTMVPAVPPRRCSGPPRPRRRCRWSGGWKTAFEWSWDESTGTVTIEGEGLLPADLSRMVSVTGSSPDTLILGDGVTGFSDNTTALSPGTLVSGQSFRTPTLPRLSRPKALKFRCGTATSLPMTAGSIQ